MASYQKSDSSMKISELSFVFRERGRRANWAPCWGDVIRAIKETCDKNKSKVSVLRLSSHGNPGTFSLGDSVFNIQNADQWILSVAKIAGYFDPSASLVIIDARQSGRDDMLLQLFSMALGGVKVQGYKDEQPAYIDAGDSVTCKMEVCTTTTAN